MLSTALINTQHLIDTVRGLAAPPPPAGAMQATIVQTGASLLERISSARELLLSVTARGTKEIDDLTAALAAGTAPSTELAALREVGAEFEACATHLAPLTAQLDAYRESLGQDVAAMDQEQVALRGQLAGLAAQRDHWAAQLDSLKKQDTATAVLTAFFGPLAWAGSELASAIQYGKSTEAAYADATRNLAEVSAQAQALQAAIDACSLLGSAAGGLGSAVQNVANALSLVQADLADDALRAAAANAQTLRLFLISLRTAMTVLQTGSE